MALPGERDYLDDAVERDGHEIRRRTSAPTPGPTGFVELELSTAMRSRRLSFAAQAGSYFIAAGRQDARTGHAEFDDRYIVKTGDEDVMRFWLGRDELDAVLATYDARVLTPFAIEIAHGRLALRAGADVQGSLWRRGDVGAADVSCYDAAVSAAAFLAGRNDRIIAGWRRHADAIGGTLHGDAWTWTDELWIAIPGGREDTRIDFPFDVTWSRRAGLRTRVWRPRFEPGEPVAAMSRPALPARDRPRLPDVKPDIDRLGELRGTIHRTVRPPPRDLDALSTAARADWIVIDANTIAAGWESLVDHHDHLRAGVELVGALGRWLAPAPTSGPYR